jgi:heme-degrading monooxygenase HmoA
MIARIWTARARRGNATRYASHLQQTVLPAVQTIPGYRGATLLERHHGEQTDIIVITWWESLTDIHAFAGSDSTRAVVASDARALLESFDEEVRHFEVTLDQRSSG